jgi:hypothetical protein
MADLDASLLGVATLSRPFREANLLAPLRTSSHMGLKGDPTRRSLMPTNVAALPRMYWEAGEFEMKSSCPPYQV